MTAKTDLTVIDFDATTAVEIRKLAAEYGVKGASRGKKADLVAALAPFVAEQRKAKEAPKAAKKDKTEKAPKVRKIRFSQDELAMEENGHSDQGHEAIAATPVGEFPAAWGTPAKKDLAKDLAYIAEIRKAMETCPVCHPEIVANTAHSGSSRAGMVINVPLRADGRTKATVVAEKLDALKIEAKVRRFKGDEILTAKIGDSELKLVWDAQGRYVYAFSAFNGRKVRNVSEALRLAASK